MKIHLPGLATLARLSVLFIVFVSFVPFPAFASGIYTWTEQTNSGHANWSAVAASTNGTNLAAVSWGGSVYTSTDGGSTWSSHSIAGSAGRWNGVASSADGTKLVVVDEGASSNGYIYTSTDSGANWTQRTGAGAREWNWVASSEDGLKLVAVAYGGQIYTSTDGGANWTARDSSRNWTGVASSADGTILAATVGTADSVYVSTNSGATWTAQTGTGGTDWWNVAMSSDGTTMLAVSTAGTVAVTTNSGANWGNVSPNGTIAYYAVAVARNGSKLAIGGPEFESGGPVYVSTNGGGSWTIESGAGTRDWRSMAMANNGSKLIAGTWGSGDNIWTGTIPSTGGSTNQNSTSIPAAPSFSSSVSGDGTTAVTVGTNEYDGITTIGYQYRTPGGNWKTFTIDSSGPGSYSTSVKLACGTYELRGFVSNALGTTMSASQTVLVGNCTHSIPTTSSGSSSGSGPVATTTVPVATSTPTAPIYVFTHDLHRGSVGVDVHALQVFLNTHGFPVAASGDGSLGHETSTFGPATQVALAAFQRAHEVLPAVGFFGPLTRTVVNSIYESEASK